jgi:hypothetical protein
MSHKINFAADDPMQHNKALPLSIRFPKPEYRLYKTGRTVDREFAGVPFKMPIAVVQIKDNGEWRNLTPDEYVEWSKGQ